MILKVTWKWYPNSSQEQLRTNLIDNRPTKRKLRGDSRRIESKSELIFFLFLIFFGARFWAMDNDRENM